MSWKEAVRGRLVVPVKVETTIYYDMGAVKDVNAHGMSEREVSLEAEDMVMEYLDKKLTPSRRITSKYMKLTVGKPRLK